MVYLGMSLEIMCTKIVWKSEHLLITLCSSLLHYRWLLLWVWIWEHICGWKAPLLAKFASTSQILTHSSAGTCLNWNRLFLIPVVRDGAALGTINTFIHCNFYCWTCTMHPLVQYMQGHFSVETFFQCLQKIIFLLINIELNHQISFHSFKIMPNNVVIISIICILSVDFIMVSVFGHSINQLTLARWISCDL